MKWLMINVCFFLEGVSRFGGHCNTEPSTSKPSPSEHFGDTEGEVIAVAVVVVAAVSALVVVVFCRRCVRCFGRKSGSTNPKISGGKCEIPDERGINVQADIEHRGEVSQEITYVNSTGIDDKVNVEQRYQDVIPVAHDGYTLSLINTQDCAKWNTERFEDNSLNCPDISETGDVKLCCQEVSYINYPRLCEQLNVKQHNQETFDRGNNITSHLDKDVEVNQRYTNTCNDASYINSPQLNEDVDTTQGNPVKLDDGIYFNSPQLGEDVAANLHSPDTDDGNYINVPQSGEELSVDPCNSDTLDGSDYINVPELGEKLSVDQSNQGTDGSDYINVPELGEKLSVDQSNQGTYDGDYINVPELGEKLSVDQCNQGTYDGDYINVPELGEKLSVDQSNQGTYDGDYINVPELGEKLSVDQCNQGTDDGDYITVPELGEELSLSKCNPETLDDGNYINILDTIIISDC